MEPLKQKHSFKNRLKQAVETLFCKNGNFLFSKLAKRPRFAYICGRLDKEPV